MVRPGMRAVFVAAIVAGAGCTSTPYTNPFDDSDATSDTGSTSDPTTTSTTSTTTTSTSTTTSTTSTSTGMGPGTTTDDSTSDASSSSTGVEDPCGNGIIDPGEECDDGNIVNSDACTNACTLSMCGDGQVQLDAEECDDGNMDDGDGCDATCNFEVRFVFVTSAGYNGDLDGLEGADEKCNTLAAEAGLTGYYQAWLSEGGVGPVDRFLTLSMDQPYVRTDGVMVAQDWTELVSGALLEGISRNEYGAPAPSHGPNPCGENVPMVWSNTTAAGEAIAGAHDCVGWDVSLGSGDPPPRVGAPGAVDGTWSDWCDLTGNNACLAELSLYCVEQ